MPRVGNDPTLVISFLGAAGFLIAWSIALCGKSGRTYAIEVVRPVRSHYIQAGCQLCLYAYWGWHWPDVYASIPLFVSQLVFLYGFDALLSWSRGATWRLGFGPVPIVLSTNVFIWFRDDVFFLQFAMVAVGALGKHFLQWEREGRRTHIFNPSAFALALASIALIATGTTSWTWATKIADTVSRPPHIYLEVFVLGVVVQYFFSVTLVTLTAAATLLLLGFLYFQATGTYFFHFSNIPLPIFLGFTLLVTDPSTSPRTNVGKAIFGLLYGLSAFAAAGILDYSGESTVYDKLLPIPVLNLCVRWIDRVATSGPVGRFTRWEAALPRRRTNLAYMGCWVALFAWMLGTGYVEGPHEGRSLQFWTNAFAEGRPGAAKGRFEVAKLHARENLPSGWNELGLVFMEGGIVPRNPAAAARYFSKATRMGDVAASVNLVTIFLSSTVTAKSLETVNMAFDHVERQCAKDAPGRFYALIGAGYETGRGRPADRRRAREFFEKGCARGDADACAGLARLEASTAPDDGARAR